MKSDFEARLAAVQAELDALGNELADEIGVTAAPTNWLREARYCVQRVQSKLERDARRQRRTA